MSHKESSLSNIRRYATKHESCIIPTQSVVHLRAKLLHMGFGVAVINTIYIENYGTPYARKVKTPALLVVDLEDKGTLKTDIIRLEKYISQHSVIWGNPNDEHFLISKISRVDQNLAHITELSMSEIRSALGWSKEVVIENE